MCATGCVLVGAPVKEVASAHHSQDLLRGTHITDSEQVLCRVRRCPQGALPATSKEREGTEVVTCWCSQGAEVCAHRAEEADLSRRKGTGRAWGLLTPTWGANVFSAGLGRGGQSPRWPQSSRGQDRI